jgi:hypothetical protein
MMMKLRLSCGMCGKYVEIEIPRYIDGGTTLNELVQTMPKSKRWITQQNGTAWDTYCSKTCAK